MNSLVKSELGVAALLAALLAAAVASADAGGETNGVLPSWNNYPTKNMDASNLPNGSATLDNPNDAPQGNVQTPPAVIVPPQQPNNPNATPQQPKWPHYPPQMQNRPRPPGYGKKPNKPNKPNIPPGYRPPGVQWDKPNSPPPGQQGMMPPGQMDPEFFRWLNQIYEMWRMHQDQQGERQGGPAGGATPGGTADFLVD